MRHTVWGDSGVVHVGAVVSVVNDEYTVRPAKTPEAFGHEMNYAFWGWDDAIILKDLPRVTTKDDQGRVRRNRETGHRRDQGVLRRLLAAQRQGEQVRLARVEVYVSRHRRGTGDEQPRWRFPVV